MLPSEMAILMAIAIDRNNSKRMLSRPMDITGEYIGYLYDSLASRGYLKKHGAKDYRLTPAGQEAIARFLKKQTSGTGDPRKRLRRLGIDTTRYEKMIAGLGNASSRVK